MAREVALHILQILETETSKEKMLSKEEILQLLSDRYDILIEEKSFYRKIDEIIAAGYKVERTKGRTTKYYLNTYRFNEAEMLYLTILLLGNKDISTKEANTMVRKLVNMPIHSAVNQSYFKYKNKFEHLNNPINFINRLSLIVKAIEEKKVVSCKEILSCNNNEYKFSDVLNLYPIDFKIENNNIYIDAFNSEKTNKRTYLLRNLINVEIN